MRSGNRSRIDFDVASEKEQEDEELAGNTAGDFKFTRGIMIEELRRKKEGSLSRV